MPFLVGYVTPQDFGAKGDGTTDDSGAFNSALASLSASGATLFIPAASYKIASGISVTVSGTQIVGSGWGSQILFDGNVVSTAVSASANTRFFMRDLRITQTNASHLGTALDISQSSSGTFERLLIDGTTAGPLVGIKLNSSVCLDNNIRGCRITYGGASSTGITISASSNSNTIQDVRLVPQGDDAASSGVYITNSTSTSIIKAHVESAAGFAVQLDTGAHGTSINRLVSISNNVGLKVASGVIGTSLYGSTISASTTAALQDSGTATQVFNAWPNSGTATYNHISLPNTDAFTINGLTVPANQYVPSDHGFLAWGYDPTLAFSSTITVSGTVYLAQVVLRYAATITKASFSIATAASGVTANQNFLGLYDSTGTRQAVTATGVLDTVLTSTGAQVVNFASSFSAPAGSYWIALVNNATTPVTLGRATSFQSTPNANLTAAAFRWAINGTAQTSLPATITPASNSSTNNITFWSAVG